MGEFGWLAIGYAVIAFATMAGVTYYMTRQDGEPKPCMIGGDMSGTLGMVVGIAWPFFLLISPIFITIEVAQKLGYKAHDKRKVSE